MPIKYNAKKIYFKDWFTFKIISHEDKPIRLECGVSVSGKAYRVRYIYDANEIDANCWENDKEVYLMHLDELPEKITPFVRSLFRYLRKEFKKAPPTWINRSKDV